MKITMQTVQMRYILSGSLLLTTMIALAALPPQSAHRQVPISRKMTAAEKAELDTLRAPAYQALHRAESLFKAGNLAQAEVEARRAIDLAPVIGGQKDGPPLGANALLVQIDMKRGNYSDAATRLERSSKNEWYSGMNLDLALCYVRAGKPQNARRIYSNELILRYKKITPADLPGLQNTKRLEASILMARGLDQFFRARDEEALETFNEANRIVPKNGVIAFYTGMSLVHLGKKREAMPYFKQAANLNTPLGQIARNRLGLSAKR